MLQDATQNLDAKGLVGRDKISRLVLNPFHKPAHPINKLLPFVVGHADHFDARLALDP
jgi:hypothetical protein